MKDYRETQKSPAKHMLSIVMVGLLHKTLDHVETRGRQRVAIYHAVFENNPDVTISVYFGINDRDHQIQGYGTEYK